MVINVYVKKKSLSIYNFWQVHDRNRPYYEYNTKRNETYVFAASYSIIKRSAVYYFHPAAYMLIYHAGMFSVWIIISYENILWVVIRDIQSTGRVSIGNRNVSWKPIRELAISFFGQGLPSMEMGGRSNYCMPQSTGKVFLKHS